MSSVGRIARQVDRSLAPIGFERRTHVWNRRSGPFVHVIDLQLSQWDNTVTVNVGVLDEDVHRKVWQAEPSAWVEQPDCTVRVRIGELVHGRDIWWPLEDPATADRLTDAVVSNAVPILERMRDRQAMLEFLEGREPLKRRDWPTAISLAVLRHDLVDHADGCAMLSELQEAAAGGWKDRAATVAAQLGCNGT